MNLKLPAFIPWMVLAGMAHGQVRTADVLYTFREAHSQPAFRLGDECFVSLDTVQLWGWKVDKQGDSVNLTAEGKTVRLDTRFVGGKLTIPLRKAIAGIGGQSSWTSGTDTLNVYSVLTDISVKSLRVHADGGMTFKATPFYISPGRTIIDFDGARLGPSTQEDFPSNVSVSQYRPNVVRLTVSTSFVPKLPEDSLVEAQAFDYQIAKDQELAENPNPVQSQVSVNNTTSHPPSHPAVTNTYNPPDRNVGPRSVGDRIAGTSQPFPETVPPISGGPQTPPQGVQLYQGPQTVSMTVDSENDAVTVLGVHLSQPYSGQIVVNRTDPTTLEVVLPCAVAATSPTLSVPSMAVESAFERTMGDKTAITLRLVRPMGSEIISTRGGVAINLFKPNVGDGRLAGKIIVVDPGHGGHDKGAHMDNVNEKDLNLLIGRKLGADLAQAGATVIMTRQDDTFIPLIERSQISNRSHADFYISCHINSTGGASSQSGTITFYHQTNRVCSLLAQCIQDQIKRVNRLPDLGAWSDHKIYDSGFSVLRLTKAPAVLIEMGFINNSKDRARMVTQDFQDSVAAAIVKGVRVYLGDAKPNE